MTKATDTGKWEKAAWQKAGEMGKALFALRDHDMTEDEIVMASHFIAKAALQAAGVKELVEAAGALKPFVTTWLEKFPKNDGYGLEIGEPTEGLFTREMAEKLHAALSDNGEG